MGSPYPGPHVQSLKLRISAEPELRHRARDHAADTASVVRVGQCGLSWGEQMPAESEHAVGCAEIASTPDWVPKLGLE
jgi:hypothetical protein